MSMQHVLSIHPILNRLAIGILAIFILLKTAYKHLWLKFLKNLRKYHFKLLFIDRVQRSIK